MAGKVTYSKKTYPNASLGSEKFPYLSILTQVHRVLRDFPKLNTSVS